MKASHDKKIIWSMIYRIRAYRKADKKNLPDLSSSLDSYIDGLFDCDPEVRRSLREKWWVVEEINALALAESKCEPLEGDQLALENTLEEILSILEEEIKRS